MSRVAVLLPALALLFVGSPCPVSAAPPHAAARLDYTWPAQCPGESAIHDEVARRLGYDPFTSAAAGRVAVRIHEGAGGKLIGDIEVYDARGARSSTKSIVAEKNDCVTLVTGIGASIGFAIDTGRWRAFLPPAPAPAPVAPAPAPPPYREPLPAPPPSRPEVPPVAAGIGPPRSFRVQLGLATVADMSVGPAVVVPGFALGLGLRFPHFSIAAEGRADLPLDAGIVTGIVLKPGEGVRGAFFGGSIVALGHWDPGEVFGLFGGGLATAGAIWATSYGVETPASAAPFYFGLGGRAGAEARFGRFALRAYADVVGTAHPVRFLVSGEQVWLSSAVSGAAGFAGVVTLDEPPSILTIGPKIGGVFRQ